MRLFYNLLFGVLFLMGAPFYFFKMWRRGNWQRGFWQRFGLHDRSFRTRAVAGKPVVWMHAVSVGEVNICVPLQQALEKQIPDADWVVSTTTSTGMAELCRKLPSEVHKIYYPVDLSGAVAGAWRAVRPTVVILLEAEIWPNFLWRATDRSVPVILVNARLSDRSHRGYRRWRFFFGPIFKTLAAVAAQSEEDCRRWIEVGCQDECVRSVGNMKFDIAARLPGPRLNVEALLAVAGIRRDGMKIVAGSTHAGEEVVLAQAFLRLREEFPGLLLILVPRHMERARAVVKELRELGLPCLRRSQIDQTGAGEPAAVDCLLVDSTGELNDFYRVADVAFVGKSLVEGGGQNPIEPAALGKPVITGPEMRNFRDVTRLLVAGGGLRQVDGHAALVIELRSLLANRSRREMVGAFAQSVVTANCGSLATTASICAERIARNNPETLKGNQIDNEPAPREQLPTGRPGAKKSKKHT